MQIENSTEGKNPICSFVYLPICVLAVFVACTQTPTPTVETVQFSVVADRGSAPLIEELVAEYSAGRPYVTIDFQLAVNTQGALEALHSGQSDFVSLSWLPDSEKAQSTLWFRAFARDALAVIAHPSNTIGSLTLLQIQAIFEGQTQVWAELGGSDHDVIPVSRDEGAGARRSFESLIVGRRDVTPTSVVLPSDKAVVEFVASTPGAIGYVSPAWLAPSVNILAVEGVTPSPASVQEGRYLLAHPFYLAGRDEPTNDLADFWNWVSEGEGQQIIKRRYAPAP